MMALFDFFFDGRVQVVALLSFAFQVWMAIEAARREEWIWAALSFFFIFSAVIYFVIVYLPNRSSAPARGGGFELPGSASRKRIQELNSQIHHLDKAHHHMELGDVYLGRGKSDEAEKCYRAAFERDADDADILSRMGRILIGKEPERACEFLEKVCRMQPHHDYGSTMMCLAEVYEELGRTDDSIAAWQGVLQKNAYARAKVQLAGLLLSKGETERARGILQEAISEHEFAPKFAKANEREWIRKAKGLLAKA